MDFASHLAQWCRHASTWGYPAVIALMAIESSFIPFPSEVVMIPAGFLAARGELTLGNPWLDLALVIIAGLVGSLLGAYVNYFLALRLGEPFLRKYGKYFFLKAETLERSQEIFRKYGAPATFVCRLLPAIRQLISLPAGLARMPFGQFTLYTGFGAGIWGAILAGTGFFIGRSTTDLSYEELVPLGKQLVSEHYWWIILLIALFLAGYWILSKYVMKKS